MPKDPVMLLSFVNMKLRDFYSDLESLCKEYQVAPKDVESALERVGYYYDRTQNSFVAM